jgi:hypothetical protein
MTKKKSTVNGDRAQHLVSSSVLKIREVEEYRCQDRKIRQKV